MVRAWKAVDQNAMQVMGGASSHITVQNLQTRAVDDLVVDGELATLVVDDEDADAATTVVEGLGETGEEVALVEDGQALLDVTRLGHGDDAAVIADVEDAVLLEDGTDHVLDDDGWAGVADEGRLLVQLLGEEVDAEVAVLAGLGRRGDADHLAGTTLEHEQVTDADVVARDGDGVGDAAELDGTAAGPLVAWGRHLDFAVGDGHVLFDVDFGGRVLVATLVALERMQDAVGSAVETVTEGVVVTVFVVISHINLVAATGSFGGALLNLYLLCEGDRLTFAVVVPGVVLARVGGLVLPSTRSAVLLGEWGGAVTELSLGDVDASVEVDLGGGRVTGRVLAVVDAVLNVDLGVGVAGIRLAVGLAVDVDFYARVDVLILLLIAADA